MTPDTHVPDMHHTEQITGDGGSKVWATAAGGPTVDLWAQDADRCNMARVEMDAAAWRALAALAGAVAARLEVVRG